MLVIALNYELFILHVATLLNLWVCLCGLAFFWRHTTGSELSVRQARHKSTELCQKTFNVERVEVYPWVISLFVYTQPTASYIEEVVFYKNHPNFDDIKELKAGEVITFLSRKNSFHGARPWCGSLLPSAFMELCRTSSRTQVTNVI